MWECKRRKKGVSNKVPWRKYRIGIHSEPIRTIPIHVDICIRANANHSEPIRKTFCNSFDEKRSKINPIHSTLIRSITLNIPEPSFQSESFQARIVSNRIFNHNHTKIRLIRINSDCLGLKTWFGFIRINASD